MTGIAQGMGIYTAADFKSNYLCPTTRGRVMPSFVDCSKLVIDVRTATAFASANTSSDFYANPTTAKFCPGGRRRGGRTPLDSGWTSCAQPEHRLPCGPYPMPVLLPTLIGNTTASIQKLQVGQTGNLLIARNRGVSVRPYPAAINVKPPACETSRFKMFDVDLTPCAKPLDPTDRQGNSYKSKD